MRVTFKFKPGDTVSWHDPVKDTAPLRCEVAAMHFSQWSSGMSEKRYELKYASGPYVHFAVAKEDELEKI